MGAWPNSVMRPAGAGAPGLSPGKPPFSVPTPGNDNFPLPRPANDNLPGRRLPPGWRGPAGPQVRIPRGPRIPLPGALGAVIVIGGFVWEVLQRPQIPEEWIVPEGWKWFTFGNATRIDCTHDVSFGGLTLNCNSPGLPQFVNSQPLQGQPCGFVSQGPGTWSTWQVTDNGSGLFRHTLARNYRWCGQGEPQTQPQYRPAQAPRPIFVPLHWPAPLPLSPGMPAPAPSPWPQPGPAPDVGYGAPRVGTSANPRPRPEPSPQPRVDSPIRSEPPPRGDKEKKARVGGPAIEFLLNTLTEVGDISEIMLQALPRWKMFQILQKYRSADGKWQALTPAQKMLEVFDNWKYFDQVKFLHDIAENNFSDRQWAMIGDMLGEYQRGPWDNPQSWGGPNTYDS